MTIVYPPFDVPIIFETRWIGKAIRGRFNSYIVSNFEGTDKKRS